MCLVGIGGYAESRPNPDGSSGKLDMLGESLLAPRGDHLPLLHVSIHSSEGKKGTDSGSPLGRVREQRPNTDTPLPDIT